MLYRVKNETSTYLWVIADDNNEAKAIAIDNGFSKDSENLLIETSDDYLGDFYQSFKNRGVDMTEVDLKKGVGRIISTEGIEAWRVRSN